MSKCWCGGAARRNGGDRGEDVCLESEYHDPFATGDPDKVMDIYIAGPMTGIPENNYPAFNEAARYLRNAGYFVVNPAEYGGEDLGRRVHYVDLLREDLRQMLQCRGICVLDGWWNSTGARNEVNVGGILRMPVRTLDQWLARAPQELSYA